MNHRLLAKSAVPTSRRGATLIFVAVALTALLAFVALAVDIGYAFVVRNELQNVADAAALAGARHIGHTYEELTHAEQLTHEFSEAAIELVVKAVAEQNQAGALDIDLNDVDIEIGRWDFEARTLTHIGEMTLPNAVRVTARRDGSANGPISTFFAGIIGRETTDVSAVATAALSGQSTAGPGGLPIPVGISRAWFENSPETCDQDITFHPTGTLDGCAGWHTYTSWPSNDSKLRRDIIEESIPPGTFESPETIAGETDYVFIGGTMSENTFDAFFALYDYMRLHDEDGNDLTWTAAVPVYDWDDCSNPNTRITIVGFTTVVIHTVLSAPNKTIVATVMCDFTEPGRGGGGNYGTQGSIPGLVQ